MGRATTPLGNRFIAPVIGGAIAVLLVSAGLAAASIPDAGGVINGCYNSTTGALRVIDTAVTPSCASGEIALNWNQTGPRGPAGPVGPPGPGADTPAGQKAFLTCTGVKQGKFVGGVITKGLEGHMEVASADHSVVSPRDPATGQATGKRQHKPLTIVKAVDRATPQLYNAFTGNETLTSCLLKFYKKSSTGVLTNYYTITLTNASIAQIDLSKGDARFQNGRLGEFEEISFVYQKIEWKYMNGTTPIIASDDVTLT
jgi:type VI secretion system secreted protein Hcp